MASSFPTDSKFKARRVIHLVSSRLRITPKRVPISLQLVTGLFFLIIIGTGLLLLPGMTNQPINFFTALFTATSAATVTGLNIVIPATTFSLPGQIVILFLVQIGGVGLIVTIMFFFRILGRQIGLMDRLAVTSALRLDSPAKIISVVIRVVIGMLIFEMLGALALGIHWLAAGIVPESSIFFYAIFHSVVSFCNAGFDLFTGLPQYPNGIPLDSITLIIMGILIIAGGLGIPVYFDLLHQFGRRGLSLHTRITLITSLTLVILGWVGFIITEYRLGGVLTGVNFIPRVVQAWFQSVSARTAGFQGFTFFTDISQSSILLLIFLMFIGTGPASAGGGITTGTFSVIWLAFISYARGLDKIRAGRRTIPFKQLGRAGVIFMVSITLVVIATLLILLTNSFSMEDVLFEVVSAFSTTGLSLGITSSLNQFGQSILILVMFCGRLGAFTIMMALLDKEPRQNLVDYPEESVLLG
jgi:trk system potassium uptake protein TrkH